MKKPANEKGRLERLREFAVLDTEFERQYDDLSRLAAALCDAPVASVSLVDENRVWFKAVHRIPDPQISREDAICSRAILAEGPHVVEDLAKHPEYSSLRHVAGIPYFRAYLGIPLVTSDGFALGTLCVFDMKPREFSAEQISAMAILARQVMTQLELARANRAIERSQRTLREERARFKGIVEDLHEVVFRADGEGRWTYLNPAWSRHLGYEVENSLGEPLFSFAHPEEAPGLRSALKELSEGRLASLRRPVRMKSRDGTDKVFDLIAKRSSGRHEDGTVSGTLTDLTPLLAADARSREQEQFINSFYSSSPFSMGIIEALENDFLYLSINPAGEILIGSPGRPLPMRASELHPGPAVQFWRGKFDECSKSADKKISFECPYDETSGRWLRVYLSLAQAEGPAQRPRFSFITADITEERARLETLQSQRNLLETVSEYAGDVIWMSGTPMDSIIFVSKAYERLWGQSRDTLLAERGTFLAPIHPEDRPRVIEALPKQVLGTYDETYRVNSPAGERWVRDRAFPVKNASGKVVQLVGIASDVTEVRSQEEAMRREKENLELLLRHLPLGVCVYDAQGLREYVNEQWTKIFGWTLAEVAGTPMPRTMFEDEETALAARAFRSSNGVTREFSVRTKSGEVKQCQLSVVQLPTGRCMTAQQRLIEEQRQAMIESARLSSLGEMAAGVAHEINNPLAIIQGSADLVITCLERGGIEQEKLQRTMERISTTVNRIAKIIVGLKSFARDGARDPLVPASLRTIIGEALELCQTRFRNNGVELHLDLPEHDVVVTARPVQLAQVLVNLLNNCFDAVAEQSSKKVQISLREDRDRVFLSVLDNGPGVPPDLKEKIMQPFFTTKPPGKGTGLGLSLSRSIVEAHGGRLSVRSVKGMTCFEAELPAASPAPARART
jgi:PAS domain S-box-containing protein